MYQIGNEEDSREKKKIGGRIFLLPKLNETEVSVHYLLQMYLTEKKAKGKT